METSIIYKEGQNLFALRKEIGRRSEKYSINKQTNKQLLQTSVFHTVGSPDDFSLLLENSLKAFFVSNFNLLCG